MSFYRSHPILAVMVTANEVLIHSFFGSSVTPGCQDEDEDDDTVTVGADKASAAFDDTSMRFFDEDLIHLFYHIFKVTQFPNNLKTFF